MSQVIKDKLFNQIGAVKLNELMKSKMFVDIHEFEQEIFLVSKAETIKKKEKAPKKQTGCLELLKKCFTKESHKIR